MRYVFSHTISSRRSPSKSRKMVSIECNQTGGLLPSTTRKQLRREACSKSKDMKHHQPRIITTPRNTMCKTETQNSPRAALDFIWAIATLLGTTGHLCCWRKASWRCTPYTGDTRSSLSCRHATRSTHRAQLVLHRAVVISRQRGQESCHRPAVQGKGSTVDT